MARYERREKMTELKLITPGDVLYEEFMSPYHLSSNKLAIELRVPSNRISEIIKGKRDITPDTALRLAKFFGNSPDFWMNLQVHFNLEKARLHESEITAGIKPIQLAA